jgi:hypothetical protein
MIIVNINLIKEAPPINYINYPNVEKLNNNQQKLGI